MKYCYTLLIFVFIISGAQAQSNFKPGYIVNLKGDTVQGFVDYREWDINPESILFKSAGNVAADKYDAKSINAFAVTGNVYFEKYTLPVSLDPVDVTRVSFKTQDSTITKTIFLKVIANGKIAGLYKYTDDIKTRFFIKESQEQNIKELTYHVYYTDTNAGLVKKITRYRNELQYIAQKNDLSDTGLSNLISNASYDQADILKIVQAINKNKGEQFISKSQFGARFFLGLGYSYNTIKFSGSGTPVQNGSSANSSAPIANAGIDMLFNKTTQQLFIRIEASYTANHYNLKSSDNINRIDYELDIKQNTLTLSPQVVYNIYSKDDLKIYISTGLLFNISTYNDHYKVKYFSGVSNTDVSNYPDFNKSWLALPIKAGVILNKQFEINAGYILPSSIVDYGGYSSKISSYQIGVKYLLGSKN